MMTCRPKPVVVEKEESTSSFVDDDNDDTVIVVVVADEPTISFLHGRCIIPILILFCCLLAC